MQAMRNTRRTALLVVLIGGGWLVSPAAADECPKESTEQRAARVQYEEAVVAAGKGDYGGARKKFERVIAEHPSSHFACWARQKVAAMSAGRMPLNKNGRAAFIIGSTLFATWTAEAIATIAMLGDDDISEDEGKGLIWTGIGGAAVGLVPSILLSSDLPMSTGRATLINFGWLWGAWHGAAISLIPDDISVQPVLAASLGGSVAGWVGTFLLTHYVDVADGDAALISSGAVWSTWLTAAIGALIAAESFFEERVAWVSALLAGGDAGLVAAALVSRKVDISAGRVGLINLGGLLGAMLGGGILAVAKVDSPRGAVGIMLGTTITGLVATTWLTRNYDRPDTGAKGVALLERTREGWAFGLPPPRFAASRESGWSLAIPLIGGQL
jgi:hypothetical protein